MYFSRAKVKYVSFKRPETRIIDHRETKMDWYYTDNNFLFQDRNNLQRMLSYIFSNKNCNIITTESMQFIYIFPGNICGAIEVSSKLTWSMLRILQMEYVANFHEKIMLFFIIKRDLTNRRIKNLKYYLFWKIKGERNEYRYLYRRRRLFSLFLWEISCIFCINEFQSFNFRRKILFRVKPPRNWK